MSRQLTLLDVIQPIKGHGLRCPDPNYPSSPQQSPPGERGARGGGAGTDLKQVEKQTASLHSHLGLHPQPSTALRGSHGHTACGRSGSPRSSPARVQLRPGCCRYASGISVPACAHIWKYRSYRCHYPPAGKHLRLLDYFHKSGTC